MEGATPFGTFYKNTLLLEDDTLENWAYTLRTRFLPYSGVHEWWSEARSIFAPEMHTRVNQQITATDTNDDFFNINE